MEYYLVSNSADKKEVGHYIQCKGIPEKFAGEIDFFKRPNSMTHLSNDFFPNIAPNLVFELEEKAILTDIISTSNIPARGLLVNLKTKDLLSKLKLAKHKFFPAIVIVNNLEHKYFWLHFVKKDFKDINLKKSKFYLSKFGFDKGNYVSFNSYNEALDIKRKINAFIRPETIVFDNNVTDFYDIFYLPLIGQILISETGKNTILDYKVSGILIKTLNLISL